MPRKKQKGTSGQFTRPKGGSKSGGLSISQSNLNGTKQDPGKQAGPKKVPVQQNQRPIVPFLRNDRILLIGEGEFVVISLSCTGTSTLL